MSDQPNEQPAQQPGPVEVKILYDPATGGVGIQAQLPPALVIGVLRLATLAVEQSVTTQRQPQPRGLAMPIPGMVVPRNGHR